MEYNLGLGAIISRKNQSLKLSCYHPLRTKHNWQKEKGVGFGCWKKISNCNHACKLYPISIMPRIALGYLYHALSNFAFPDSNSICSVLFYWLCIVQYASFILFPRPIGYLCNFIKLFQILLSIRTNRGSSEFGGGNWTAVYIFSDIKRMAACSQPPMHFPYGIVDRRLLFTIG